MTAFAIARLTAACVATVGSRAIAPPSVPAYTTPTAALWLEQGWTDAERDWFHHASQGTATLPIPYGWFIALERPIPSPTSPGLFSDRDYLDRFGFIPSASSAENPAGLPVGFARTTTTDPTNGKAIDQLGFTCAACHTGRFDFRGTSVYVDGGPAMTDIGKFRNALGLSLGLTLASPPRFLRFAARVLGRGYSLADLAKLKVAIALTVREGFKLQIAEPHGGDNIEEGFGRLDALNRIGNEVFASQLGDARNYAPLSAPVAYPNIWDTHWFDWVQYNSSIEQPMVRNAGEAMGVRALVKYTAGSPPRFTSTIPLDRLDRIEGMLAGRNPPTSGKAFSGLHAPAWPEEVLPRIDRQLAAQGEDLYGQYCSGCHLPAVKSEAFWSSPAWSSPNAAGQRYLRLPLVPVSTIGTDPAQAIDMKNRTVRVPLSFGFSGVVAGGGASVGSYPYGPALGQMVERVVYRWYDDHDVPATERERMNGFRANGIRDGAISPSDGVSVPVYKARPLDGIWATAPYLHNGSVPTLYDLLSPYAERPASFWLGNREFDPVKVGFVTAPIAGGFLLRTVDDQGRPIRGNSNGGHLFETPVDAAHRRPGTIGPTLSPPERKALVEYLKTL